MSQRRTLSSLKAGILSKTFVPENQNWYFYVFLAFLAGFSERLVPDFLGETEKTIARGAGGHDDAQVSSSKPTR